LRRAGECCSDDHPHVHGANLGFSADLYRRWGAFLPLAVHEDVALVADDGARAGAHLARNRWWRPAPVRGARVGPTIP